MWFGEKAEAILTIDEQQQNSSPRRILYNDDDIIYVMLYWDLFRTLKHRMAQLGQYKEYLQYSFMSMISET